LHSDIHSKQVTGISDAANALAAGGVEDVLPGVENALSGLTGA
jgi:hypothetical protein